MTQSGGELAVTCCAARDLILPLPTCFVMTKIWNFLHRGILSLYLASYEILIIWTPGSKVDLIAFERALRHNHLETSM